MLNAKQCELARLMSNTRASNEQINLEYMRLSSDERTAIAKAVDQSVSEEDKPFDQGINPFLQMLKDVAAEYSISAATVLAIFLTIKSEEHDES